MYAAITVYAMLCLVLYLRQNSMIFLPPPPSYDMNLEHLKFELNIQGEKIAMQIRVPADARAIVVYTHGNAVDIGQLSFRVDYFNNKALGVCLVEYPGYGLSEGTPSEQGAYQALDACVLSLQKQFPDLPLIFYGRSVGTGPAIYAATKHENIGLILESPMRSAQRVLLPFRVFPWDVFNNQSRITQVSVPVLFIHGEKDQVIPIAHAQTLSALCPSTYKCCWLPEEDHNSILPIEKTVDQHIQDFLAHLSLAPLTPAH